MLLLQKEISGYSMQIIKNVYQKTTTAETNIALATESGGIRTLKISTSKTHGGVSTYCNGVLVKPCGSWEMEVFGNDYAKRSTVTPCARVTAKTLETAHAAFLVAHGAEVVAEVEAHYAKEAA